MSPDYNPESYNAMFSRIEQKLDDICDQLAEIKEDNKILRERISSLEHFKYYLMGVAAVFSFIGSYLISKIKGG